MNYWLKLKLIDGSHADLTTNKRSVIARGIGIDGIVANPSICGREHIARLSFHSIALMR
jgi:hypothetical protein